MTSASGPRIIEDGLVFAYDMENTEKSWKGKPLTNYYGDISTSASLRGSRTQHYWNGKRWLVDASYTDPGIDGPDGVFLGLVYKHTSGALNSTWSGNSYGYMLKDIPSTSGNRYTMSAWTYISPDCNIDGLPCSTEGATTVNITVSGYQTEYNLSQKGTWQRIARGAISDGNVRWIPVYPRKNGVTDGSFTGFFMWAAAQVEDGDSVSRYAGSDVSYARSSSQSLVNLTNKLSNGAYAIGTFGYNTDNTFSFIGTNYYSFGDMSAAAQPNGIDLDYTVNLWFKPTVVENYRNVFDGASLTNYGPRLEMNSSGNLVWVIGRSSGGYNTFTVRSSGLEANQYHNVALTVSGALTKTYYNGELVTSTTATQPNDSDRMFGVKIGNGFSTSSERYFKGDIPIAQIYNRVLTDAEVKRNFNAIKWRYGL